MPRRPSGRKQEAPDPALGIRLNKYLSNSGVSSRRQADELIKAGKVKVNGKVVMEMGHKVMPGDKVQYEGKQIKPVRLVYVLLNKPKDIISTTKDQGDRMTVLDLVRNATDERIYPVGRLDRNTTGLLLLTNDGELAEKLTHPRYRVKKLYAVGLDKPLTKEHFEAIRKGVKLEEGVVPVDDLAYTDPADPSQIGILIHIGWNRVVRRLFEELGYKVKKLDRTIYAGLTKKDLPRGRWRHLTKQEIITLKHLA